MVCRARERRADLGGGLVGEHLGDAFRRPAVPEVGGRRLVGLAGPAGAVGLQDGLWVGADELVGALGEGDGAFGVFPDG